MLKGTEKTIATFADVEGADTAQVVDLSALYGVAIDNSHEQHIERGGVLHPSSVDYCMRTNYWAFFLVPPTDRRSKRLTEIMNTGHHYHAHVQDHLQILETALPKHGINCEFVREVPYDAATDALYLDLGLGGTCDGILKLWTKHWEQLGTVEIKSQNDEFFKVAATAHLADPKHLKQAHIYAFRFQTPIIWIWYVNKNNSKRHLIPYLFSDAIFGKAIGYFETLRNYIEKQQTPPRQESWFECSECVYKTKCGPTVLRRKNTVKLPQVGFARTTKNLPAQGSAATRKKP